MTTRQDRYALGFYDREVERDDDSFVGRDRYKVRDPYWSATHGYTRRGNLSWVIYRFPMWPIAIAMVFWLLVGLTIVVWSSLPAHAAGASFCNSDGSDGFPRCAVHAADEDQMVCDPIDGGHGGWICVTPHHDDDEDGE